MKEENKKRINKLLIPFTRRTLSFFTATTILATGAVGCREKEQKDKNKDNSSIISSISDEEITSSDNKFTIDDNSSITNNESSKNEQTNNNEVSNNVTSNNKNNSTNTTSSNKNQNNTSSINIPSVSTPSQTPTTQTMPTKLTAENINDVLSIDYFTDPFSRNLYTVNGEALYTWISYYYNGVMYDCKRDELRMFVSLLNNDYISDEALKNMFSDKSLDDITRYAMIIRSLCGITFEKKAIVHYENFVVNNDKKIFLKNLESSSRNVNDILAFTKSFYAGTNNYFNYGDDIVLDYYVYLFASKAGEVYNNEELTNIYINYVNSYVDFKSYVQTVYTKSRAKTLIK